MTNKPHDPPIHADPPATEMTDDLEELLFLVNDRLRMLSQFASELKKVHTSLYERTTRDTFTSVRQYELLYKHLQGQLLEELRAPTHPADANDTNVRTALITDAREFLRSHQQQTAALVASTDWQSPSFGHTLRSRAGRQTGTIYATINDYKRDQHADAHRYEREFIREYVRAPIPLSISAYATSSGMAAFTTILDFLLLEKNITGPVLVGRSVWFQNMFLLFHALGDRIQLVAQQRTNDVLNAISKYAPRLLFFDSLENSPDIGVPDLDAILTHLVKTATQETYVVIDNTCLTLFFQPIRLLFAKRSKVRLIVFESLNKYHQFGMDRTTGGIIWTYGPGMAGLFDYRVHLGTIIPDVSVLTLPSPDRRLLTKRLLRHGENTTSIAGTLQRWIDGNPASPFARIVYPGLDNHPSHAIAQRYGFSGSFFVIEFKSSHQSIPVYQRFVGQVLKHAKRKGVDLTAGTSFGLDTTRIYLTAVRSSSYTPFIRVAVGCESEQSISELTVAFIEAFEKTK